jgi:hypothetical protein
MGQANSRLTSQAESEQVLRTCVLGAKDDVRPRYAGFLQACHWCPALLRRRRRAGPASIATTPGLGTVNRMSQEIPFELVSPFENDAIIVSE